MRIRRYAFTDCLLLRGITEQTDSPSRPQQSILSSLRFVIELHSAGMPPVNLCPEYPPSRFKTSSDTGIFGRGPVRDSLLNSLLRGI